MGREIRMVPPNWQHPQEEKYRPYPAPGRVEIEYVPMHDRDAEEAWANWQADYAAWLAGEHDRVIAEYGAEDYPMDAPYRAFCAWHGEPPDPSSFRPKWADGTATWFQVYETVSEGTPVTPPFATREELADYLVANGDFWDQKRRQEGRTTMECGPWKREAAERFVNAGWVPSLVVTTTTAGADIKGPRDG